MARGGRILPEACEIDKREIFTVKNFVASYAHLRFPSCSWRVTGAMPVTRLRAHCVARAIRDKKKPTRDHMGLFQWLASALVRVQGPCLSCNTSDAASGFRNFIFPVLFFIASLSGVSHASFPANLTGYWAQSSITYGAGPFASFVGFEERQVNE